MSLRVTLLGMNEIREMNGITNEKDWSSVTDQVPVSILFNKML